MWIAWRFFSIQPKEFYYVQSRVEIEPCKKRTLIEHKGSLQNQVEAQPNGQCPLSTPPPTLLPLLVAKGAPMRFNSKNRSTSKYFFFFLVLSENHVKDRLFQKWKSSFYFLFFISSIFLLRNCFFHDVPVLKKNSIPKKKNCNNWNYLTICITFYVNFKHESTKQIFMPTQSSMT